MPEPAAVAFTGFTTAALDFYEDLEDDNTKSFWEANRATYERECREPMRALVAALQPQFGAAKVYRPYRDLRYSLDKTPYKTHQGAYVSVAGATGYYVQVDAAGLRTCAGWYDADAGARSRYREAVDHDRTGAELEQLVTDRTARGFELTGDTVKTRPRGWAADHPRIELLRHNTLDLGRRYDDPDWLATPAVADQVRADWLALEPLLRWHVRHVRTTEPTGR